MGKVTVYCIISGCTPEIASNLRYLSPRGPVVTRAIESLADQHELCSQDDLCVVAPVDSSGRPYWQEDFLSDALHDFHPDPETDVRVVPHCVMGDSWEFGFVDGPPVAPPNEPDQNYVVSYGYALMVQTYALDIMALATGGRMTPLRLWRLAMKQGFEKAGRSDHLEGVDYGVITGPGHWEQFPEEFEGFTQEQLSDLEEIGDEEVVKQRLVHEGCFWLWMAPDRFPVSSTKLDSIPTLPKAPPSESRSAIESLPSDVLIRIISSLPLPSLINLASSSRLLRNGILGNDYLACDWLYNNAPWWIPVSTQTPRKVADMEYLSTMIPQVFLASWWSANFQLSLGFPTGLDWAYVLRCVQSGSMRNRERIWNAALDIQSAADLTGV